MSSGFRRERTDGIQMAEWILSAVIIASVAESAVAWFLSVNYGIVTASVFTYELALAGARYPLGVVIGLASYGIVLVAPVLDIALRRRKGIGFRPSFPIAPVALIGSTIVHFVVFSLYFMDVFQRGMSVMRALNQ